MHFQVDYPQTKLVSVITGEIFDVAVDIRPDSATISQWYGVYLSETNRRRLLILAGFAHVFCVISKTAPVTYKYSDYYYLDRKIWRAVAAKTKFRSSIYRWTVVVLLSVEATFFEKLFHDYPPKALIRKIAKK